MGGTAPKTCRQLGYPHSFTNIFTLTGEYEGRPRRGGQSYLPVPPIVSFRVHCVSLPCPYGGDTLCMRTKRVLFRFLFVSIVCPYHVPTGGTHCVCGQNVSQSCPFVSIVCPYSGPTGRTHCVCGQNVSQSCPFVPLCAPSVSFLTPSVYFFPPKPLPRPLPGLSQTPLRPLLRPPCGIFRRLRRAHSGEGPDMG